MTLADVVRPSTRVIEPDIQYFLSSPRSGPRGSSSSVSVSFPYILTVCATTSSHARRSYAHTVWGRLHGRNYLYFCIVLMRVRFSLEGARHVPHLRVILEGRHPYIAQPGDLVHPNISIVTQNAYRRSLGCMSLYPPPLIRIQPTYTGPHNGFKYKQQPRLPCLPHATQCNGTVPSIAWTGRGKLESHVTYNLQVSS